MSNSYFGNLPNIGEFPFQIITGGGTKTYQLSFTSGGTKGVLVFVDGAVQRPDIDYSANGDVIVFSENVTLGAQIFVYGLGLPKSSLTDINGEYTSLPIFSVQWMPSRNMIPAGYVAADGQELSRATFNDAFTSILAGNVPSIDDTTWLSTPTERGKYSLGNGTTTFRMPDYNGKFAGSLGAAFLRGDGELSGSTAGTIQRDALQDFKLTNTLRRSIDKLTATRTMQQAADYTFNIGGVPQPIDSVTISSSSVPAGSYEVVPFGARISASETRPLNVTGCWCVKLFGAVVNQGSADVGQLASDYANLLSRTTLLESQAYGIGQRWYDVKSSRAIGGVYKNETNKTITANLFVQGGASHTVITMTAGTDVSGTTIINPVVVASYQIYSNSSQGFLSASIPPGMVYRLDPANVAQVNHWAELRE